MRKSLHQVKNLVYAGLWITIGAGLALVLQKEIQQSAITVAERAVGIVKYILVTLFVLLVVRCLWNPVTTKIKNFLSALAKFGADKKVDESWESYWKRFGMSDRSDFLGAFRYFVMICIVTSLLQGVMGVVFSLVTYLTAIAQNQITSRQNEIAAIDQVFQMNWTEANDSYQSVSAALTSRDSSLELQKYAIKRIPEVMSQQVVTVSINEASELEKERNFPNLKRSKELLKQFISRERVGEVLGGDGFMNEKNGSLCPEEIEKLRAMSNVSTELLRCLHRLGSVTCDDKTTSQANGLWNFTNDKVVEKSMKSGVPRAKPFPGKKPSPGEKPSRCKDSGLFVDLSHLSEGNELIGLAIPFYRKIENCPVFFPYEVDLHSAQFQHAQLDSAMLVGCKIRSANLQYCSLEEADLTGAVIHQTNLAGARLGGSHLHCVQFSEVILDNADLSECDFSGRSKVGQSLPKGLVRGTRFWNLRSCKNVSLISVKSDGSIQTTEFGSAEDGACMDLVSRDKFIEALNVMDSKVSDQNAGQVEDAINRLRDEICNLTVLGDVRVPGRDKEDARFEEERVALMRERVDEWAKKRRGVMGPG